ncbi:spermidine/putrescine ABC transporter substrate-binding protein [Humibacter sp. RRB41]|uniref:polyamine ABC transporter substrate-binding protein n=1 Tax=Humibacter sp. RRB41 TaxID=2919946 RepID=UPI001FA9CBCD|nr:spermidine/putrescine ABC transporter substrate-binding protein [Humibacter sp. RRB41]
MSTSAPRSVGSSLISRRTVLGAAALTPIAAFLAACSSTGSSGTASAKLTSQLNIYTWPDYFSDKDLAAYAKKYGVTPKISTYTDNNTLFTKLNSAAGAGYDIVVPSSSWIKQISDKGLLEELDLDRFNLKNLDQSLLNRNYDPHNKYSIPKDWGLLGVVYDPDAVGGEIKTWQDFFDAGAKSGASGRIRMTSAAEETVGPALWVQGKDWNTKKIADIQGTEDFLTTFAKHVKTFSAFDPNALKSGAIVMAQANQAAARNAILLNPKLKWVVPGPTSELWVDSFSIAKGAPDVERAYEFLKYQLTPTVQVNETVYLGYPASLNGLRDKLPSNVKESDLIFGGPDVDFDKLTSFIVNPDTYPTFQDIQNKVQAAAGA